MSDRHAVICGGNRIPFARQNRSYADASNQDMLTAALDGLVSRFSLQDVRLGSVAAGAVLKRARDFNLVRECVLGSRLDSRTPAYDLQMACDTGLQATATVAAKIATGEIECGVAGGVDTTSDAPIEVNEELRQILLDINKASGTLEIARQLARLRPGQIVPALPRNEEPRTGLSMGEHTAVMARDWQIGRTEQDELALASHRNLAAAYDEGFFDELVTPYLGLQRDENMRPEASMESLGKLSPVFGSKSEATMTAGNSTPLTDGASTVLLASEQHAEQQGWPALARLTYVEEAAVDYVHGPDHLLSAPLYAVPALLERAGLTLQDFDFYEIHEAFAAQVLATLKAWEDVEFCRERLGLAEPLGSIDRDKLNVKGSSLGTGHPFAATGGRIVATLAKLLADKGSGRGLISICAAGGQGMVAILER